MYRPEYQRLSEDVSVKIHPKPPDHHPKSLRKHLVTTQKHPSNHKTQLTTLYKVVQKTKHLMVLY